MYSNQSKFKEGKSSLEEKTNITRENESQEMNTTETEEIMAFWANIWHCSKGIEENILKFEAEKKEMSKVKNIWHCSTVVEEKYLEI